VLDGNLDDAYWHTTPATQLKPIQAGIPAGMGGEIRVGARAGYVYLSARLPEPGGKVLARSIGRNPIWEKDALESPEVEDRIHYLLRFQNERILSLAINPWGAYRLEESGKAIPTAGILAAARVTTEGWTVEAAVPQKLLDADLPSVAVEVTAERIRSRRALAPEFRWSSAQPVKLTAGNSNVDMPEFRPPALGNTDPPLEIGRVSRLPEVVAGWEDPAWKEIPSFDLARNEPYPRPPQYATQVKWMHDGRTLALLFRMVEPEPVVARAGGRDSAVTSDDHVALYLATSGSAFLEIAVNSVGAIRDTRGMGPHIMRPDATWNADIRTQTNIRHGHWIARIDIPLNECASALGEDGVPRHWRVLIARYRAGRPGEAAEQSVYPVIGAASAFYGPVRYQRMVLSDSDAARMKPVVSAYEPLPQDGLAGELAALDSQVWSAPERRRRSIRTMLPGYLEKRVEQAVLAERQAWEKVKTRHDWELFRDQRIQALRKSVGKFPLARPPLDSRVTARHEGDGYVLENIVFQSRPGFWMTANLYRPPGTPVHAPAMLIVHSQHYPKTQGELHDMGELWARTGCVVLIMERPGYGERVETTPWYRQAYASRFTFTKQLFLVGESYSGWAAWDVIRSVDYLLSRPEVDKDRIIVLGSVAGGGEPAAVAAALDPRITAVVPFNYDQGHVRVHGDSPGQIAQQFSPWLVAASVAPRRFVRAFEFGWEGAEEPDYPKLWVDGMKRSEKVWSFYDAQDRLASSQAYGLIRLSMERVSHCFSIGPQQRAELYPIFKKWFNIPFPSSKDLAILPDSQLSTNPQREEARLQEVARRRPHADLLSLPPAVSAQLSRKKMHQIAYEMGKEQLRSARERRRALDAPARREQLRKELRPLLGDIDPPADFKAETVWTRSLRGASVEAMSIQVEDGIAVPLLMIRPQGRERIPAVIAVAAGGKERFLSTSVREIEALLQEGIAVCLPDLRGMGETSPGPRRGDGSLAEMEFDLSRNLLGSRLKDLRTVVAYLRNRPDIDPGRLAMWGDSFVPENPKPLFLDEIEYEGGPQVQYTAEPAGAHLALLSGLYEDQIAAIAARRGLAGYLSVLEAPFTCTPMDVTILAVLKVADIADIAGALAPRPLALQNLVNGRNLRLEEGELEGIFAPASQAYEQTSTADRFTRELKGNVSSWLITHLQ
jgi:dienelactone hydrolase